MKKIILFSFIIILVLVAAGCFLENPMEDMGVTDDGFTEGTDESTGGQKSLPPDKIDDTLRDFSGSFKFETILPVALDLTVKLYDAEGEKLSPDSTDVFVSIKNSSGKPVFSGMANNKGRLQTEIRLPGAPEEMSLRLEAVGFKTRTVKINDMVKYASIDRTMALGAVGDGIGTRDISGLKDSDGDGVPDVYDAMPGDKKYAFSNTVPADGVLTIAFEDLLGRAQAGDADYNDFIAEYTITEDSDTNGIKRITVDAKAKVKLAGYKHRFGFRINDFAPPAPGASDYELEVTYVDQNGNTVGPVTSTVSEAPVEVILFEDTAAALGKSARFTLNFAPEDVTGTPQSPEELSRPPYNPYIYVYSPTKKDIHLIDEEPITGSNNPDETFRDGEGFPWALLVPPVVDDPDGDEGWFHPPETERIEWHYPRFTNWRESGGEDHSDWYLFRDEPVVEEPRIIIFSSDRDGDFEIYSLDMDSETLTQLTFNTSTDKHPALSPEGTKIAFVSNRSGNWAIHTMNADGTGVSSELYTLFDPAYGHPSWSPDASQIVFDDDLELHIINSDGTDYVQLTSTDFDNEYNPDWSPDGTSIVYTVTISGGDLEICTKNSNGSGTRFQVTDNTANDDQPSWSPDGTEIVYSTDAGGNNDIYTIGSDGSSPDPVLDTVDDETAPSWSENGIAYVKNDEIYTFQPGTPGSEQNVTNDASVDQDPSW